MIKKLRFLALSVALAVGLSSCGDGQVFAGLGGSHEGTTPLDTTPANAQTAARFLTQATFGPTDADIKTVLAIGYEAYLDRQLSAVSASHLAYMDNRLAQMKLTNPSATVGANQFYESYWLYAATGQAQLRERMKLALSEIFVISLLDSAIDARGAASYYDMLGDNAFGNYRNLLEQVSLHPQMGRYLTHLGNQKEDTASGRKPDENFAREVLQLMSIGTYMLNDDGTIRRDGSGQPLPSYTASDISNLAKVFTGYSWYSPTPTNTTFAGGNRNVDAAVRPMIYYANYHSISEKTFLGVTLPAGAANGPNDLKTALDTIFNHPNVPPFMCQRLIQRLVTSNPTPGYISRCSAAFINNGAGVRGDLKAVVKAILLDPEARNSALAATPTYGKLREPLIRVTNWMRAFGAASISGNYLITSTSANTSLGQSPLSSPSVFNFYRPGYVPPNTRLGDQNLTAPEFQIVDEVTVAGYANTMQTVIGSGIGSGSDVRSAYVNEVAIADDANALVDRMNLLLLSGQMSDALRVRIIDSLNGVVIPKPTATNQATIATAKLNRAKLAIYMTMVSPEYLVQR
ncbi:DUF1800 domain-containing protein [Brevundimonas sp. NIBR11]|uniref:DUF1800 domain-containing protein n=1 Tax=Brevundimonas sp. NIBR11 TaxID=3015999 RepID=UPI0022F010A3|nr:DUF1800 domain-containing protein [Brevundimonas sp. NIBR11]WGM30482.1 hypothetical protein KKHFBJBL_00706 [Brevundimonas sp. NIBR11]